jgi:ABC-2 type transport system permease protein
VKAAVLYGASLRWRVIEFRRYAFDTLSSVLSIYGFFVVIFLGAKLFGGDRPGFGHTLEGVVVSYALWAFTILSLGSLTFELTQEATEGTLEQLGMSPFGLVRVLLARVASSLVVYFVVWSGLLLVMMTTTGKWLNLDVVSVVPLLFVTLVGMIGVGFVLGGQAIVFKRIQNALQIYQILIIALVVVPADRVTVIKFLPLGWGTHLLQRVLVDGDSIFELGAGDLLFLVANSLFYFLGGIAVFRLFERAARERGLLGHY